MSQQPDEPNEAEAEIDLYLQWASPRQVATSIIALAGLNPDIVAPEPESQFNADKRPREFTETGIRPPLPEARIVGTLTGDIDPMVKANGCDRFYPNAYATTRKGWLWRWLNRLGLGKR